MKEQKKKREIVQINGQVEVVWCKVEVVGFVDEVCVIEECCVVVVVVIEKKYVEKLKVFSGLVLRVVGLQGYKDDLLVEQVQINVVIQMLCVQYLV